MNINLNASINGINAARLSSPVAPVTPVKFNTAKAMPGDVVTAGWYRNPGAASIVQNTPEERKALRDAIAAHLPRFHFWTGYIGEVNNAMGVNHYWEIPSSQISQAIAYVDSMFQPQPVYPSYSQAPAPAPVISEDWINARYELEAALNQFETYRRWFKEQADLMDYAIKSVKSTLAALQ